jgi:hypothetical protein
LNRWSSTADVFIFIAVTGYHSSAARRWAEELPDVL